MTPTTPEAAAFSESNLGASVKYFATREGDYCYILNNHWPKWGWSPRLRYRDGKWRFAFFGRPKHLGCMDATEIITQDHRTFYSPTRSMEDRQTRLRRCARDILSIVGAHPNYIVFTRGGDSRETVISRIEDIISQYASTPTDS
jgi:hypothetical protein